MLTAVLAALLTVPPLPSATADTQAGRVRGVVQDGIAVYRGIPYAAPPVGPLRWRAPQSATKWPGVRDATRFSPSCPQALSTPTQLSPIERTAEDCLYLNIWAPAGEGGKHPVMLWVHGGGFIAGSGSEAHFNGSALAREGVLVVTINYRLGRLGFFVHPALETAQREEGGGNFGLLDQIAAIKWVRRNIANFGGDPGNITLFGQSAGGISILTLAAAPAACDLFQKAIILSGTTLHPARDRATASALGQAWAAKLLGGKPVTAEALRALPVEQVAPSAPELPDVIDILAAAGPVVDGSLIRENPWRVLEREGLRVPIIVGSTSRDALIWSFADGKAQTFPFWSPKPEQIAADPAERRTIFESYRTRPGGDQALAGDVLFGAGAFHLATLAARSQPAWLYRFDAAPAPVRALVDGAPHGSELFYLFGTLGRFPLRPQPEDADDGALSRTMIACFTAFARNGAPPANIWPRFDPAAPTRLDFSRSGAAIARVSNAGALRAIVAANLQASSLTAR